MRRSRPAGGGRMGCSRTTQGGSTGLSAADAQATGQRWQQYVPVCGNTIGNRQRTLQVVRNTMTEYDLPCRPADFGSNGFRWVQNEQPPWGTVI